MSDRGSLSAGRRAPIASLVTAVATAAAALAGVTLSSALGAVELRGRLVDGTAMLRQPDTFSRGIDDSGFTPSATRVPMGAVDFRLTLVDDGRSQRSWRGRTDDDGRFAIELTGLDPALIPAEFVASVEQTSGPWASHHSLATEMAAGGETELRLYNASEDASFLRSGQFGVFCSLTAAGDGSTQQLLLVQVVFVISNVSGDLYVGRPLNPDAPASTRACIRIPLPGVPGKGLDVVANEASRGGQPFTITPDGWAILDSPLPPYPEAPGGARYTLEYTTRAHQEMVLPFPIDVPIDRMAVFGVSKDIALTSVPPRPDRPGLQSAGTERFPDPKTREPVEWDILQGQDLRPGGAVPVALTIDSQRLGEVNQRSLRVVGGFVVGAIIAMLAGLLLGRRGPRVEALLSEASGEEIIERIAQLDAQFKKGLVSQAQYDSTRERLLWLARHEVPELAEARGSGSDSSSTDSHGALSQEAIDIVERIEELGDASRGDPKKIQVRVLLLEELARVISRQTGRAGERRGAADAGAAS